MKRIFLFLATNMAVVMVLGIVMNIILPLLGISPSGYGGLLAMAFVFGMIGSVMSLLMSKRVALGSTRARIITSPQQEHEVWLVDTVKAQAEKAGIGMPDVAIYDSPDVNAFATGAKKNAALVAVSTGLLNAMTRDEAEAVLGHEVAHVANGDMVTMALIQGVLNTFVLFLSRIIASMFRRGGSGGGAMYYISVMVLQMVFGIVASFIAAWFSRQREFRADRGGAEYASRDKMIAALRRLQQQHHEPELPEQMAAFGISGMGNKLASLRSTHPPLADRIAALEAGR